MFEDETFIILPADKGNATVVLERRLRKLCELLDIGPFALQAFQDQVWREADAIRFSAAVLHALSSSSSLRPIVRTLQTFEAFLDHLRLVHHRPH